MGVEGKDAVEEKEGQISDPEVCTNAEIASPLFFSGVLRGIPSSFLSESIGFSRR